MSLARPKLLAIADTPNWIFERHARHLQHALSDEFDIDVAFLDSPYEDGAYDLVYPLEFNLLHPDRIQQPWKYVTALRSHIAWDGVPPVLLARYLTRHYQRTHVVSKRLHDLFAPHLDNVAYVTHGIDTARFAPVERRRAPGAPLRVGWAGNRKSPAKGFEAFVQPLASLPGVELVMRGFSDRNLTIDEMPAFYADLDVYVCSSSTEGNNNALLEAAATGCAIVTTDTGTVPEYLPHREAALVVSREADAFRAAVIELRDDTSLRLRLGAAAARAVHPAWSWHVHNEHYRTFFRDALHARADAEARVRAMPPRRRVDELSVPLLDTLQKAMASGNLLAARANVERLVTLNPTNAEFRVLYQALAGASNTAATISAAVSPSGSAA